MTYGDFGADHHNDAPPDRLSGVAALVARTADPAWPNARAELTRPLPAIDHP